LRFEKIWTLFFDKRQTLLNRRPKDFGMQQFFSFRFDEERPLLGQVLQLSLGRGNSMHLRGKVLRNAFGLEDFSRSSKQQGQVAVGNPLNP
jgi:hypothetical protein